MIDDYVKRFHSTEPFIVACENSRISSLLARRDLCDLATEIPY